MRKWRGLDIEIEIGDWGHYEGRHHQDLLDQKNLRARIGYTAADSSLAARHIVGLPTSVEVFDHGGTLLRERRATYDPATGNLTSFTAKLSNGNGPTQTATIGRRLSLDNPDAGLTEYRYDPAGNLINMRKRGGSLAGAGRGM